MFIDKNELKKKRIIAIIIKYLIKDFLINSLEKMKNIASYDQLISQEEKTVDFSQKGNYYLENIINNKVINSSEVSKFDNNCETIVLGLFKAYYSNPKLLDKQTLNRICFEIKKLDFTDNVIDFNNGCIKLELHKMIKLNQYLFIPTMKKLHKNQSKSI